MAIAKLLAEHCGLAGSNNLVKARADEVYHPLREIHFKVQTNTFSYLDKYNLVKARADEVIYQLGEIQF